MRTVAAVTVRPVGAAGWDDLQTVFGTRGTAPVCQCQRFRLERGECFESFPAEERADRLRQQVEGDDGPGPGLLAHLDGEPVGWCAVGPRAGYPGLVRSSRAAWSGRDEDRTDPTVWAVTCLFTRAGYRRRGVSKTLARAAVEHARRHGALAIEAYPMTTTQVIVQELGVGTTSAFQAAGFREISRPTPRRAVMRLDLAD
ncbi:GNAT family N-acetyltransferase [Angustibacter aerolatus]